MMSKEHLLEREIEKILVREVCNAGGYAYKFSSPGNDGVPDRIVIFPNKPPVFVELKTDNGKLSSLQKVQLKRLKDLGQDTYVVYGIRGVRDFFHDVGYAEVGQMINSKYKL